MSMRNPEDTDNPISRRREGGSMASRIEAIAKARPPAPKGKGIVMILLGIAVLWALIDTFSRGSSAKRAVEDGRKGTPENPPLAPKRNPDEPDNPSVDPKAPATPPESFELPGAKIELPEGLPPKVDRELRLNMVALASAGTPVQSLTEREIRKQVIRTALRDTPRAFAAVPATDKPAVRRQLLELFVRMLPLDQYRGPMFACASSIADGFGEESEEAWFDLHLAAYQKGLADDAQAPGAILFLGSSPTRLGAPAAAALDVVILDVNRPLHVRVLAAQVRPLEGRGTKITTLAKDPATPPALRQALNRSSR